MRIAHVLTYVSADGAFGGPLAVLAEQVTELARRGHHVEVFAGWDGTAELILPGVDVHLFRTRRVLPVGFSGLTAPGLHREVLRRRGDFDAIHVHLARDLITTPVAYSLRRSEHPRLFLQPHGMVKPDARLRARILDLWVRPALAGAAMTFSLTSVDSRRLTAVEPRSTLRDLPNGVSLPALKQSDARERPEVLFLARLQPRKRVLLFAQAAHRLLSDGVAADFTVVGPDEGDLAELEHRIAAWDLGDHITYEGAVPPGAGRDRISRADVYVLPSLNEPFPMSVLEAMSSGTATVISETCHIADRLGDAVAVFSESSPDDGAVLAEQIRRLLDDDSAREDLGRRGRRLIDASFSIAHVGDMLENYYADPELSVGSDARDGTEDS